VKPTYYCQTPEVYGHTSRPLAALESVASRPAVSDGPPRSLVVEGNKAWVAAGRVRRRWLSSLMARRTAPKQAAGFLAGQLLRMPRPLAECLPRATGLSIFTELTGRQRDAVLAEGETAANGRLLLLALSPVLTSYEHEMVGDGDRKATWRTDRANPYCSRSEAGDYLRFLISVGYEAAPIEKAVADGVPYTGDVDPGQGPMDGDQTDTTETANTRDATDAA
jgi:ParB family chromosome partitioning protein